MPVIKRGRPGRDPGAVGDVGVDMALGRKELIDAFAEAVEALEYFRRPDHDEDTCIQLMARSVRRLAMARGVSQVEVDSYSDEDIEFALIQGADPTSWGDLKREMARNLESASGRVYLYAASLFSSRGFNNGEMPADLWVYLEEIGEDPSGVDWSEVLHELVDWYLLPWVRKDHEIELATSFPSGNPVRIKTFDGEDVSHLWVQDLENPVPGLEPDCVSVPFREVLAVINKVRGV